MTSNVLLHITVRWYRFKNKFLCPTHQWYNLKRWVNIKFFGWKDAEKEFPKLNEIVIIKYKDKLINRLCIYRIPKEFPDFCENEEQKRMWYSFQGIDNSVLNATGVLWKPYYGQIVKAYDEWDIVRPR
jgi:hypothetical protein